MPKSPILTTRPCPTRQLRVARSRCTKCSPARYTIPAATWLATASSCPSPRGPGATSSPPARSLASGPWDLRKRGRRGGLGGDSPQEPGGWGGTGEGTQESGSGGRKAQERLLSGGVASRAGRGAQLQRSPQGPHLPHPCLPLMNSTPSIQLPTGPHISCPCTPPAPSLPLLEGTDLPHPALSLKPGSPPGFLSLSPLLWGRPSFQRVPGCPPPTTTTPEQSLVAHPIAQYSLKPLPVRLALPCCPFLLASFLLIHLLFHSCQTFVKHLQCAKHQSTVESRMQCEETPALHSG